MLRVLFWSCLAVLAVTAPSNAQSVIALGSSVGWQAPDGTRIELETRPGQSLAVTNAEGAGFAFEHNGTLGLLLDDGIAVRATQDGCFEVEVSEAFATELIDVELTGRVMDDDELDAGHGYQGPALRLRASVSAEFELAAEVAFCLRLEPGTVVTPQNPRRTQRMVLAGFREGQGFLWSPRLDISAEVAAGPAVEFTVEAYCNDQFLDPPTVEDRFRPTGDRLPRFDDLLGDLDGRFREIGYCLWAARALEADYAMAVVTSLDVIGENGIDVRNEMALYGDCLFALAGTADEQTDCLALVDVLTSGAVAAGGQQQALRALSRMIDIRREVRLKSCARVDCDVTCFQEVAALTERQAARFLNGL